MRRTQIVKDSYHTILEIVLKCPRDIKRNQTEIHKTLT